MLMKYSIILCLCLVEREKPPTKISDFFSYTLSLTLFSSSSLSLSYKTMSAIKAASLENFVTKQTPVLLIKHEDSLSQGKQQSPL